MMKILHIWDQAGVGCILSKYQRRLGHHVKILKRTGYDPFNIFSFYNEQLINLDGKKFIHLVKEESRKYDIIHIHSLFKLVPLIRKKGKNKFIILHFHGSELRNAISEPSLKEIMLEAENKSNMVIVSTPDLLEYSQGKTIYLNNPVDREHFKSLESKKTEYSFFTMKTNNIDLKLLENYLKINNLNFNLQIYDRFANPISYSEMPDFLRRFNVYVDIRFINNILLKNLSKTALEALACNLRVLRHDLKFIDYFPQEHDAYSVTQKLMSIIKSDSYNF